MRGYLGLSFGSYNKLNSSNTSKDSLHNTQTFEKQTGEERKEKNREGGRRFRPKHTVGPREGKIEIAGTLSVASAG